MKALTMTIRPHHIQECTAMYYGLDPEILETQTRLAPVTKARHIAMYLCRTMTSLTLREIAHHFGRINHATVIHACRKVEAYKETYACFKADVRTISDQLDLIARTTTHPGVLLNKRPDQE